MKQDSTPARTAAWLFLAAPAFLAIPAHAQEATPQAATPPPPVVRTVPQPATPPETSIDAPATVRGADPNSSTRIAPGAADVVDDARIAARAEQRTQVRREPRRTPTVTRAAAPVTAVAASAPTPAPSPAAAAPVEAAQAPAAQPAAPAEPAATTTEATTTQATDDGGVPLWPLAAIVALIVAVGAFFLLRRRKADAYDDEAVYHEEPVYAEPAPVATAPMAATAPVATPVAAAVAMTPKDEPVAAGLVDETTVTDAPAEDVAALTGGAAAVHDRPWLELAMRPVRAGTSADEALVEIELTVANSGSVKAEDVRVSTFMLTDAHASEMERLLVDAPADAAIDPVTIEPGEGTRIDATLAALKADLGTEGRFTPVVVADARYRLPDGSEGRTSASFVVGVSDEEGGTLIPIDLADRVMREDVEARLHGEPEHA
ncbi:hypothetical protein ASE86_12345 [Sphingomonas sp. Leaf33]|uniref:hypothetical protein n=1 Tax=Sphingomonas sp. Leaf33 TaxID=1736215 RepID=UPI0006F9A82A|nr:hypothetical protein [Sphingomonas sp. Leaf33]KQN19293.1 hypothetical protein ASE86_12345 [Sphingomonas sp. Leaf33]